MKSCTRQKKQEEIKWYDRRLWEVKESVFISYSSKDSKIVEKIVAMLKEAGISYWKAPEMIPAGSNYAREIPRAIAQCQVFLLVISSYSQESIWVEKEIDCAINDRKTIVPLKLTEDDLSDMFRFYLNNVQTISYAESHDQALVGDKTIVFRLIDADMYWHMQKGDENYTVNRGIALHKMIRLLTATTINGGYLNFMGNEFGHPEWIDFPREGNGWSCKYARRQWNLVDNKNLAYHYLGDFDCAMLEVIKSVKNFQTTPIQEIWHNDGDQILAYMRKDLIFVFNFNPKQSFTDYGFLVPAGKYEVILNTDNPDYGGHGLTDDTVKHFTLSDPLYKKEKKEWLKLYIPARTAMVLKRGK